MPYFFILPVFAALFALEALCVLVCAGVPSLRPAAPYAWRIAAGSFLGFLSANAVSCLVGIVPTLIVVALRADRHGPVTTAATVFALLGLFVGPLIVSPLGFLGGAWIGLRRARRERVAAPQLEPVRQ